VTPRDDLRDRMLDTVQRVKMRHVDHVASDVEIVDALLDLGLVDASAAREGRLHSTADGDVVRFGPHPGLNQMLPRVLVISADGVSRETGS